MGEADAEALVTSAYTALRALDRAQGGLPVVERRQLLKRLAQELVGRADRLVAALEADFGRRAAEETLAAEILCVVEAIRYARARVRGWARPRRVAPGLAFWPATARILARPKGVVAILSPWNYPIQLALSPLVGALAAGNRVLLKPAEAAPRAAAELADLIDAALGPTVARTLTGGPAVAALLTQLPLDHVLFTGSAARGVEVMQAAATNLVPVTLELGGKCPAIVMADADLVIAARALVRGKVLNAGQTCVAPDTVLLVGVESAALTAAMRTAYARDFAGGPPTAVFSADRAARLARLTEGQALTALGPDGPGLALAPRLVIDPPADSPLLTEEVFGPLMPVLRCASLDDALLWIAQRPAPLAIYLFTRQSAVEAQVLARVRTGAVVLNGTILQAAIEPLPFGGVGGSGFGRYHGRAGFDTFSTFMAHVRTPRWSLARLTDPPYGPAKRRLIERILRR